MLIFIRLFFQLFWIGLCVVAMVWQTRLLVPGAGFDPWLVIFIFGATVFGYSFRAPSPRRWPAWLFGAIAGFCFFNLPAVQQLITFVPALIWVSYYDMYRPGPAGLRQFPAAKPVAIALAWAWVTVLLPLSPTQWITAGLLFAGRTAFVFALALAYDLCDRMYDRRQGLQTLVMRLGATRSFRLIDAALLLNGGMVVMNLVRHMYDIPVASALIAGLFLSRVTIRRVVQKSSWGDWRKVVIDGLMVLQALLAWVGLNLYST